MGVKDEEGEDGVWWRIVYRYVKEEEEEEEEEKMSVSGGWRSRQALTCKATVGIPQLLCKRCTQPIDAKFARDASVVAGVRFKLVCSPRGSNHFSEQRFKPIIFHSKHWR